MRHSVSVILATYNEAENVGPMIDAVSTLLADRDYEVIVVDDDSPDLTWKIATDIARRNGRVRVIRREQERGLASAYNTGILAASKDVLVWLDCDFQHPVEIMPQLLELVDGGFDAALTSRFLSPASPRPAMDLPKPFVVRLQIVLTRLLNRAATLLVHPGITDWTSGYLAIKRRELKGYRLRGDHGEYYIHLMRYLAARNCAFKELPYELRTRERGQAKTTTSFLRFVRHGWRYLGVLFRPVRQG